MLARFLGKVDYMRLGERVEVPDVTKRITIPDEYKNDSRYWFQYRLKDSDTLAHLSRTIYNTPNHWLLIVLMNDKVNTSTTPQYIFAVDNATLTKVEQAGSGIKTVEATRYFSITGAAVSKPSKGLYIRQILFTDGTRKSDKVIIR